MLDELLTPEELARVLRVPVSFVYDHSRRKSADPLPVVKIGKYSRFDRELVREWIAKRTRRFAGVSEARGHDVTRRRA